MRMAGVGALAAFFRAALAMLMVMFVAFFGAVAAGRFAKGQQLMCIFAVAREQAGGEKAEFGGVAA